MNNTERTLEEIRDRVTRTESRLVQLGDYVGANLRSKQRIEIVHGDDGSHVEIDSLDVSMSRVLTELRNARYCGHDIEVRCKHRLVCKLFINDE